MTLSEYINKDRLIKTFTELIRINAPSFKELDIAAYLRQRLEAIGCRVIFQEYDRSFNLIAYKAGREKTLPLLLSGHMDTIESTDGIAYIIEDGIIRSTGGTVLGADDKSALAQIIEALTVIHERDMAHGDIEIVFTSAEEYGLCGAKNLDFSAIRSRHALVLDSSGRIGNSIVAAPTHFTYEMRVTGRSAHAGIEPEKGINAVKVAAKIISEAPDGRIDAQTTANIGIIEGGTATNVVPRKVMFKGEIRSHNLKTLEEIKSSIYSTANRIAAECCAEVEIRGLEEYRSFKIDEKEPLLIFIDDVYKECGIKPVHVVTGGGSDANIFNKHGITTINISSGMQKVHSSDEFIEIDDLYKGSLVVLTAIASFKNFSDE